MRLHLKVSGSNDLVPHDYQQLLLGVLHKWLGINVIHNLISLYSFSWLQTAHKQRNGFLFPHETSWFISMYDHELLEQLLNGIKQSPEIFHGLSVQEVQIQKTPQFSGKQIFRLASPALIKHWKGESLKHLTWRDGKLASQVMTQTLTAKLNKVGIKAQATVAFDLTYPHPKTKLVTIHNIKNRASYCPIVLEGDPEAIQFAWDVGVGHSTGSGFGALM